MRQLLTAMLILAAMAGAAAAGPFEDAFQGDAAAQNVGDQYAIQGDPEKSSGTTEAQGTVSDPLNDLITKQRPRNLKQERVRLDRVLQVLTSEARVTKLRSEYLELTRQEPNWKARYGPNHPAVVNIRNRVRELKRELQNSIMDELLCNGVPQDYAAEAFVRMFDQRGCQPYRGDLPPTFPTLLKWCASP